MVRVHPATMNLPIVFVTAYSSLDLEDRRKEAGADMVLPKPIGMDTLIEAVEQATALRSGSGSTSEVYFSKSLATNVPPPATGAPSAPDHPVRPKAPPSATV